MNWTLRKKGCSGFVNGCSCKSCSAQALLLGTQITQANVTAAWNYLNTSHPAFVQPIPGAWSKLLHGAPEVPKDALKKLQKAPESTDVCRGWRVMFVDEKYQLVGSYGATWETKTMQAKCNINAKATYSLAAEHLAAGSCACGIWSHKNYPEYLEKRTRIACGPSEILYEVENANRLVLAATSVHYGIVIEGTEGYRSEYADLDSLWVIVPRKCRAGHGLRLKTEEQRSGLSVTSMERNELERSVTVICENGVRYTSLDYDTKLGSPAWLDANGNPPPVVYRTPRLCRPQWECVTDGDGDSNPGAAIAMALQASYGIPCRAIGASEFIYKQERGEI